MVTGCAWVVESAIDTAPSDSTPSEARKRGSGGGSPRKYHDLLAGASDLTMQNSPGTYTIGTYAVGTTLNGLLCMH